DRVGGDERDAREGILVERPGLPAAVRAARFRELRRCGELRALTMPVAGDRLPLADLRRKYVDEERPLPQDIEAALRADSRAGARAILAAVDKRRRANRAEGQRLRHLFRFEQELWATGTTRIAGVDEAGMSPLAGPVVA